MIAGALTGFTGFGRKGSGAFTATFGATFTGVTGTATGAAGTPFVDAFLRVDTLVVRAIEPDTATSSTTGN